jgi:predicted transport protein
MSDIKLFRLQGDIVSELPGRSATVEKSLQNLLEKHLPEFLGVNFLASEYTTGKSHAGRIDTLGIDENGSPVIIEYKRAVNENAINQGLYYLDWLLDHKGEFTLLVMEQLGKEASEAIEWSNARLLCIAGDFTKFDTYSVQQIPRNIELLRYRRYGEDLLLLELVNATEGQIEEDERKHKRKRKQERTVDINLQKASPELKSLFESVKAFLMALGEDVQFKTLQHYFAFKRLRNFACVEVHPQDGKLRISINLEPETIQLESGFTRDLRGVGHYGTGDLEILLTNESDFERAQPLLLRSYEVS